MEEDLRVPPADRLRRPRPGRVRATACLAPRPGKAGRFNTAADHIETTKLALAQLPARPAPVVPVRADSGGGTHESRLTARSRRLHYSVGMTITEDIQDAIGKVPAQARPMTAPAQARSAAAVYRH